MNETLLIQLTVGSDFIDNFEKSKDLIQHAFILQSRINSLSRMFFYLSNLKNIQSIKIMSLLFIFKILQKNNVNILLGSLPISDNKSVYNRSLVVDSNGSIISKYDKIHMFDVILRNNEIYKESDTFKSGNKLETFDINGWKFGHSICYDLRFPKLYRYLAKLGSKAIVIPAFTYTTGKAHWHTLVRARARNGVFILAPNQWALIMKEDQLSVTV